MASQVIETKGNIKVQVWGENSILDTLNHELVELKDKIESARKREDYGTYKNFILAFKEVVHLIHEEENKIKWIDMYSHYKMKIDDEFQDVVSTWQQKGEDIREHKIYKVEKEITDKPLQKVYIDVSIDSNSPSIIYCDGISTTFKHTKIDRLADYIYKTYKNKADVYVDTRGTGSFLVDCLNVKGMVVNTMETRNLN